MPGFCCKTVRVMRILALDHGTKCIGVAVSDETKTIAQPLEYIPAEPFTGFLERLRQLIREKEIDLILIGLPRNMDGSYGPAAEKVQTFVGVLGGAITVPIKMWDERLTSFSRINCRSRSRKPANGSAGMYSSGCAMVLVSSLTATPMRLLP